MGSSSQSPISSYYVLKEVLKNHKPKYIILELYFIINEESNQMVNALYNFEYMNFSSNKIAFYLNSISLINKIKLLFPTYYYRNNFNYSFKYITKGEKIKNNTSYEKYDYKGYVKNSNKISLKRLKNSNYMLDYKFDENDIYSKNETYLNKIIQICETSDIELILITTPLPKVIYNRINNKEKIFEYYNDIAKQNNLIYFNFDTIKTLNFNDTLDFFDTNHLNSKGANKLSTYISNIIKDDNK